MLLNGAIYDGKSHTGNTLLQEAIMADRIDFALLLITKYDGRLTMKEKNRMHDTVLHTLAKGGYVTTAELLMSCFQDDVDVNAMNRSKKTVFDLMNNIPERKYLGLPLIENTQKREAVSIETEPVKKKRKYI
jgi:hypothetical protein